MKTQADKQVTQSAQHGQKGATLIMVLFVLLLITIMGVVAARQSATDLKAVTSSQVGKLLVQSSDATLEKVENEDREAVKSGKSIGSIDNIIGFVLRPGDEKREVAFCIKPRTKRLFSLREVSERSGAGGFVGGRNNGYCDPKDSDDYIGARGASLTQATVLMTPDNQLREVFGDEFDLSNVVGRKLPGRSGVDRPRVVRVEATSVLPSFVPKAAHGGGGVAANPNNDSTIYNCLAHSVVDNPKKPVVTVNKCLQALSVPYESQRQEYVYRPEGVPTVRR